MVDDPITPADVLEAAADTYRAKDQEYGSSWQGFGAVMAGLFPDGVHLTSEKDHGRHALFTLIAAKLHRYAHNFAAGGHQDSIRDAAVYCAMLETLDADHSR